MPGGHDPVRGLNPGCKIGLVRLREHLVRAYPGLLDWGCYNPASRTPSGNLSLHCEGRAIDLGVPSPRRDAGDQVFDWCVRMADEIGLQEIIWANRIWSSRRPTVRAGGGHWDHVHVGLSWAGALAQTSWFRSGGARDPGLSRPEDREGLTRLLQASRAKRSSMDTIWYLNYNHVFWIARGQLWHKYASSEPNPNPKGGWFADGTENMSVRYGVKETLNPARGVVLDLLPDSVLQVTVANVNDDLIVLAFNPRSGWGSSSIRVKV